MTKAKPVRTAAAALVAAVILGAWATAAVAADPVPKADDKCVEQCDRGSDECMGAAGGDAGKERACDTRYDECLRKCG